MTHVDLAVDSYAKQGPPCVLAKEEVIRAINKMQYGKVAGQLVVVSEMLEASEVRVGWSRISAFNLISHSNSMIQEM